MLTIGSIIYSDFQGEVLNAEVVHELRSTFRYDKLFNIAWGESINHWLGSAYATLNLRTGELEGHDEFSMRRETPYLIHFKVSLESLSPKDILTDIELSKYEKDEQTLEQFCEEHEIDVKQRAKSYYQSHWEMIGWYIDSVIEENLFEYYGSREVVNHHDESCIGSKINILT